MFTCRRVRNPHAHVIKNIRGLNVRQKEYSIEDAIDYNQQKNRNNNVK